MDLVFSKEFTEPNALKLNKKSKRRGVEIVIQCFAYSPERDLLFGGLSDGRLYMWQKKQVDEKVKYYPKRIGWFT